MDNKNLFVFGTGIAQRTEQDAFVIRIPQGIQTVDKLYSCYKKHALFPDYFGENWNAFLDLLSDFYWIEQSKIIIAHEDIPLEQDVESAQIYLDILETAMQRRNTPREDKAMVNALGFPDYELTVIFPKVTESSIKSILEKRISAVRTARATSQRNTGV